MTRDPCRPEELRSLELFGGLHAAQLQSLCASGRVEVMPAGPLVNEGHAASHFYVLLDGEVVVCKRAGRDDVEIERTTRRGLAFGALSAFTGTEDRYYDCSVRLTWPCRLFIMDAADFAQFMTAESPMAVELINGYLTESVQQRRVLGQRDALLALGALTSGLAGQLNRPAAIIADAISHLRDTLSTTGQDLVSLLDCQLTPGALHLLFGFEDEVVKHIAKTYAQVKQIDGQAYVAPLTASEVGDREQQIGRWLQEHNVAAGPDSASNFVRAGLDVGWLDRIWVSISDAGAAHAMDRVFRRLEHTVDIETRILMISEACERISALIAGAKLYSQMDRGAYQCVDVHELLRGTLVMYGDRIAMPGKGRPVTLVKDLHPSLPEIHCYPASLNQVWSCIFDRAIRDMNGRGTLTLRTTLERDSMIRVEIGDDGPGIPHVVTDRTLVRFLTTRGARDGAGLGLDEARRIVVDQHHGTLTVESVPGGTRVIVHLPVRAPAPNHIESTVLELPGARAHEAGRGPPGVVDGNQPGRR